MKNNSLDDIVKCNVDISSPASNDATFDTILLVVAKPSTTGEKTMGNVTAISKADELLEYGYKVEDAAYVAASVAFAQSPAPNKLLVCVRELVDEAAEIPVYESLAVTLARANTVADFYGVHITEFKDPADIKATMDWIETNEKLFCFEFDNIEECPVDSFEYFRTFGIFSGNTEEESDKNDYAALAWMAKCFGFEPGTETWNLKELANIIPSNLSTEQKAELNGKHINTFLRYASSNCTIGGFTLAGEWIDVIRFRDWIKAEMQSRVFNALKVNRKVPFTDNGIGLIEGAMESTLKDGQDIGGIAPTEYDANNKAMPGYTVIVPKASALTEEERKSRKLTGCHYTARLAGAVHLVEIEGFLTF